MKRAMLYMTGFISVFFVLDAVAPVRAGSLTPGNILVSTENFGGSLGNSVFEYTTSGSLVQQFSVPAGPADEDLRGIAVNSAGQVQIYNGTFTPQLTTLTPTPLGGPGVATYTNTTIAGWSSVGNLSPGEIGVVGNYVFAGDMSTASPGTPNGIIRFDTSTNAAVRFASGTDYSNVTVGANGLVYAINQTGSPSNEIDVFNPNTLTKVETIMLSSQAFGADLRGIAVDAKGNIFGAGWDGKIYELNSSGAVVNSFSTGFTNLNSIAIDNKGDLVVGDTGGVVILTTTALTSETSFVVSNQFLPLHVNFTSPLTIASVPEPSSVVLAGIASVLGLGYWARRRGQAKGRATSGG